MRAVDQIAYADWPANGSLTRPSWQSQNLIPGDRGIVAKALARSRVGGKVKAIAEMLDWPQRYGCRPRIVRQENVGGGIALWSDARQIVVRPRDVRGTSRDPAAMSGREQALEEGAVALQGDP